MISKDTLIGDLARDHPESLVVLIGKGLHCIGCSLSPFETIEQGAKGHGFNDEEVDGIVREINESIAKMEKRMAGEKENQGVGGEAAEKSLAETGSAGEIKANAKPGENKKGKKGNTGKNPSARARQDKEGETQMPQSQPIRLTKDAAEKVMQLIKSEKKEGKGLRVYIVKGGKDESGTEGKNEKGSQGNQGGTEGKNGNKSQNNQSGGQGKGSEEGKNEKGSRGNRGGAEGKGAGGEQFEMDFDDPKAGDEVYESFGLKVFFEKRLKEKISGMEIGYRPETNAFVVRRRTMQQAAIQDLETMASEGKKRLKEKGIRESDIPGIVERSRQTQASD